MVPEFKRKQKKHFIPCNCAACRFQYCRICTCLNNCLVNSYIVTGVYLDLLFLLGLGQLSYCNCFIPKEKDTATTRDTFIPNIFFSNGMVSNHRKVYKNYRDELLNVLWFLDMSAVGHKIAHTM